MNKQINLVINGKGGVGKSFFATNFVQYLKDCGIEHRAIDSDHENSTLKRFHPEVEFINLEHRGEIDRVFTAAESCHLLLIDCRAASTDLFIDFFNEVGLCEVLRALDARLTIICPVNHEADSVEQLRILSEALHDRCAWVVVKNEAHSESFKIYDGSKTRRHVVDSLLGREITMPRLYDWLVTALNEHNQTLTTALEHPAFNLLDRQRLKNWRTRFHHQIYRAADLLLADAHAAERSAA
jgi:CobQ/CobB/MinD/ParA nucleotide binding domain